MLVRTYAPKGQPPVLRLPLSRAHLPAISGITPDGRLLLRLQERAYRSPDVVEFLRQVLRCVRGKILVIWDGASIHHAQPIKDFLATRTGRRVRMLRPRSPRAFAVSKPTPP